MPWYGLSAKEFQIFCKLAGGAVVSHIANELSVSIQALSLYRSRVLEKMGLEINAALTAYALRNGLIR